MNMCLYIIFICLHFEFIVANSYDFPNPTFEMMSPKGFRVSIPDAKDTEVFAFHGNINKRLYTLVSGEISEETTKKTGDRWIIEKPNTQLKTGDLIYYWYFVQFNQIGYRREGVYKVKDLPPAPTQTQHTSTNNETLENDSRCVITSNISNTLNNFTSTLKTMQEITNILIELVAKDDNLSRTLKFEGILPPFEDAKYVAEIIIQQKLGLQLPVVNATRNADRSVTFQVASLDDKIYLIRTAKKKLLNSKIVLSY